MWCPNCGRRDHIYADCPHRIPRRHRQPAAINYTRPIPVNQVSPTRHANNQEARLWDPTTTDSRRIRFRVQATSPPVARFPNSTPRVLNSVRHQAPPTRQPQATRAPSNNARADQQARGPGNVRQRPAESAAIPEQQQQFQNTVQFLAQLLTIFGSILSNAAQNQS